MKGLFIGLGSVGQRHLRNVRSILGDDADLLAWRSTVSRLVIEDGVAREVNDLGLELGVREFSSLEIALAERPDFAVISSPSICHAENLAECLNAGVYCFVEKPLLAGLEQIETSRIPVDLARKRVMVGYQFRFHPAYLRLKAICRAGGIGKIKSAEFVWGTYLPEHHPYEDYRDGYAARFDLGGGAINGLSHDIDLMLDLLGPLEVESATLPHVERLEMQGVEEAVCAQFRTVGGVRIDLFLSYAQRNEQHDIRVTGSDGTCYCNFADGRVEIRKTEESNTQLEFLDIDRNELFMNEMREFLDFVRGGNLMHCGFSEGLECIRIADAIRSKL